MSSHRWHCAFRLNEVQRHSDRRTLTSQGQEAGSKQGPSIGLGTELTVAAPLFPGADPGTSKKRMECDMAIGDTRDLSVNEQVDRDGDPGLEDRRRPWRRPRLQVLFSDAPHGGTSPKAYEAATPSGVLS